MARTIAFDKEKVIQQTRVLFQENGYEATSIRDLVAHVGVSSSSLYSTFGDKDALFMLALEQHSRLELEMIRQQLEAPAAPRIIIERLFDNLIEQLLTDGMPSDSLTLKAAVELTNHKPEVAAFLGEYFDEMTALFTKFLDQAVETGELEIKQPSADLARYLLFALFNLNLMVKVYPDRARLEGYKQIVLSILDQ